MAPAVTAMLDRALDFSRPYIAGRVWKLARTMRGFKPSRKPVLRLQAVPTAAESLTTAGEPTPFTSQSNHTYKCNVHCP